MAEFTTASEFPNEFGKSHKKSIADMRHTVAYDLRQLRKAYFARDGRAFRTTVEHIIGYYMLDLVSEQAYSRVWSMRFVMGFF